MNPEILMPATMASPLLLSLPGELRNEIWRLVLVEQNPIDVTDQVKLVEHAVLAVSKQVREETLSIYYGENTFELKTMPILNMNVHLYTLKKPDSRFSGWYVKIPVVLKSPVWFAALGSTRAKKIRKVNIVCLETVGLQDYQELFSNHGSTAFIWRRRPGCRISKELRRSEDLARDTRWRGMMRDYIKLFSGCGLKHDVLSVIPFIRSDGSEYKDWKLFAEQIEAIKRAQRWIRRPIGKSVEDVAAYEVEKSKYFEQPASTRAVRRRR